MLSNFTKEIERAGAMGQLKLFFIRAHVGAGVKAGIQHLIKGLNLVIKPEQTVQIAIETMAGKGTEIGTTLNKLQKLLKEQIKR